MAVRRRFNCSPDQVFAVLHDGWTYPVWVVGASRMRDVDAGWPAPGTKLHHSFGMWPLLLDDTTEVLEIEPGQRLVLEITVKAAANGSLEDVTDGPTQLVPQRYGWRASTGATARRCAGSPTWPNAARKRPSSTRDSLVVR
jgi:hypothetical protein